MYLHGRIDCTGFMTKSFYDKLVKEELEYNFTCNGSINNDFSFLDNSDLISQSKEQASTNTKLPSTADPDHFQCFIQKGLHFLHQNARSLLPKITELKIIAAKSRAAVISVTKTWLDDSVTDGEISTNNYSIVRRDRNRTGGVVCAYIRNDFAFSIRSDLQQHNDKVLFIELLLPKTRPIFIGTIYRPPKPNDF